MLFTKRQFKPSANHVGEEMLKKSVCWHKRSFNFFYLLYAIQMYSLKE